MDLLSTLIEQKDLEITKISLAQVTDQYLAYLKILQELTLDALTDFLVIAAKLILIKSEILLPAPPAKILNPVTDEASDEDLGQQLRDYKRFKHVTTWLEERQDQQQRCFIRISPPPRNPTFRPLISTLRPCWGRLVQRYLWSPVLRSPDVDTFVSRPEVTIKQQIRLIQECLQATQTIQFETLVPPVNRLLWRF